MWWLIIVAVFIIIFIAALNTDVSAKSETKSNKDLEDLMKKLHPEDFSDQSKVETDSSSVHIKESPSVDHDDLSWLLHHKNDINDIYEKKYPGFRDNTILANSLLEDYCEYIKKMSSEHPDDAYLEYLYGCMLFKKQQFKEASEVFMDMINVKRLSNVDEVMMYCALANKAIPYVENGSFKSYLKKIYNDGLFAMEAGDHYDAIDKFMDCYYYGMKQQSLITKICKCYEEEEDEEGLHEFAEEAYEQPWLSESTQNYLLRRME